MEKYYYKKHIDNGENGKYNTYCKVRNGIERFPRLIGSDDCFTCTYNKGFNMKEMYIKCSKLNEAL